MNKKIKILFFVVAVFSIFILVGSFDSLDRDLLSNTIKVDALYYEDGKFVEIHYYDNSAKTNFVTMEILGMSTSYQQTYETSSFVERVPFEEPPKYGWKTTPVTFVVDHEEFGKIGIKTEIHDENDPKPPVIFGSP